MNRTSWRLLGLLFLVPAMAAATEGERGANPFAGDFGTALWTLVVFLLVVLVLGKFAWGPVLGALQKREEFIREALETARREREQAEARLAEYERKLHEARTEALAIVDEARRDADVLGRRIEQEAQEEARAAVARAKREIAIAGETAIKDLYATSARLATQVAEKLLRRELTAGDHERLVSEAIEELEQLPRGRPTARRPA